MPQTTISDHIGLAFEAFRTWHDVKEEGACDPADRVQLAMEAACALTDAMSRGSFVYAGDLLTERELECITTALAIVRKFEGDRVLETALHHMVCQAIKKLTDRGAPPPSPEVS